MQKKSRIPYLKGKNASYVCLMFKNITTAMILALPKRKKTNLFNLFEFFKKDKPHE